MCHYMITLAIARGLQLEEQLQLSEHEKGSTLFRHRNYHVQSVGGVCVTTSTLHRIVFMNVFLVIDFGQDG